MLVPSHAVTEGCRSVIETAAIRPTNGILNTSRHPAAANKRISNKMQLITENSPDPRSEILRIYVFSSKNIGGDT